MKTASKKQLRRKLLCALVAGALAAPFAAPHTYALPIEGANAATNAGEANISTSGTVMDITGKTEHNVLRWEDFSVDSGEKVRFDNGTQTKDYLNLVTGEGASNIYGTIEGGRNVYLVNPHGILFAEGSQVNTGALYLSTADIAEVNLSSFGGGSSPLSATAQTGDVLNLGTVKASKLYIEGRNVTVLSTDAVTDADGQALKNANVTIRSEKAPHIGYDVGNKITKNIKVGTTPTPYQVSDYASTAADHHKASAKSRGWFVQRLNGAPHADYDYMRVHDVYELQHIEANLRGRYMLAGDINAGETSGWNHIGYHDPEGFMPIGGNGSSGPQFKGRFDGVGHTIEHLHINRRDADEDSYIGLFGNVNGARVENLSIVDGYVTGKDHVGGIVGAAERTLIRNVSFSGVVSGLSHFGGIVGTAKYGTICNAYNAGKVHAGTYVGGIVGEGERVTLQNVWNVGEIRGGGDGRDAFIGGIAGAMKNSTVQNALHTGTVARDDQPSQDEAQTVGGIVGQADGTSVSHAVWKAGSVTQDCSPTFIAHAVGEAQNDTAEDDVADRSLEDMKKAATYTDWKDENGNALVATAGGKGTPWRIYEGHTTPLLTALMKGTKRLEKTYDGKTFGDGDAHILSDTALQKNVGTYDARGIYSDAFGYDLIGSTYRIAPRVLTMSGVAAQTKVYDGNTNADATQFSATLNNVVTGEESLVTATATGAAYNSKDVASANAVSYTLALRGTGAGNYRIARTVQGAGTITAKQLNLALMGGARFDKTYDGNANVTQTLTKGMNYTLTNFVNGEGADIALAPVTGTYADKNAGTGKAVTFGGLTLTGAGAGNYSLSATTLTATGDIARKTLTLEGTAGTQFTKTYDGNAAVTQNLARGTNYRLAGVVEGEGTNIVALNESAAQGAYATKDAQAAGTHQNVMFTNLALTGSGAGNYTLAANKTFENAGRITPKELNLALASGTRFDKTYDGNANVAQTLAKGTNYSLTGFVTGEGTDIELAAVTGKYADKNAAADKAVTFGGLTLTGTGAGNYVLNRTSLAGIGTISRRALTLGAVAAQTKTYDGTTAADASKFGATLNNAVAGDSVTAAATGATYNDKNVAAASTIDYTGVALAGADAGNYTLAATTTQGVGSITHRDLTLTADAKKIVQGEAVPSFTGRAEGFANGEDASVLGAGGLTFESAVTNTETPGSYGVTGRIGGVTDGILGNYRIGQAAGNANAFTIHAAALPGGILAALVQDAAPRFDMGFGQEVYVFGLPRPIPTATLGIYRFDAERAFEIQGLRL
ncbi:YDG domain-containing protein [uncultured Selenomonas sp.]|uniref:YDG domain-containing protein n=1 Tax=uncultured Selenomonas sp. TaxID=159275 RepID=UPI0028ED73CD|nr:YDG domain-containing protein [uncultured Selenomonas sp.]